MKLNRLCKRDHASHVILKINHLLHPEESCFWIDYNCFILKGIPDSTSSVRGWRRSICGISKNEFIFWSPSCRDNFCISLDFSNASRSKIEKWFRNHESFMSVELWHSNVLPRDLNVRFAFCMFTTFNLFDYLSYQIIARDGVLKIIKLDFSLRNIFWTLFIVNFT